MDKRGLSGSLILLFIGAVVIFTGIIGNIAAGVESTLLIFLGIVLAALGLVAPLLNVENK